MRPDGELVTGVARVSIRVGLPGGGDVVDLHEGGDDLIFHGNRGPFVVILLLQGLVLKSESLVINTSISDTVCSKSVGEVSLLSVTKLCEEFVVLHGAVRVPRR